MPAALALVTFGAMLAYSALTGKGVTDILRNRPKPLDPAGGSAGGNESGGGGAPPDASAGTTIVDGKPVANWIVPILHYARGKGWKGTVQSGYRSPAHQAAVCATGVKPCATPGKSNHQQTEYPGGAVDVTDAPQLSAILLASPYAKQLVWAGSKDDVHFSHPHDGGY